MDCVACSLQLQNRSSVRKKKAQIDVVVLSLVARGARGVKGPVLVDEIWDLKKGGCRKPFDTQKKELFSPRSVAQKSVWLLEVRIWSASSDWKAGTVWHKRKKRGEAR